LKKEGKNFSQFQSKLELPFSETDSDLLRDIFITLESEFGFKYASNQKLIDLGAGSGNIVIFAATHYCIKAYGIEIDLNLVKEAKNRIKSLKKEGNHEKRLKKRIKIKQGDLFRQNLEGYDYIYIYSLPSMHKYLKHVFKTAKNGAIIISHKYPFTTFNSIMRDKHRLVHNSSKPEIYTFFYERIY